MEQRPRIGIDRREACLIGCTGRGIWSRALESSATFKTFEQGICGINCILIVTLALADLPFPLDLQAIVNTKEGFMQYGGFPACIGAIDGTHIQIKPPPANEDAYVGRKGFHSINVQVVCDHNLIFTDVVVKWPGSTHDTTIYNSSAFKKRIEAYLEE